MELNSVTRMKLEELKRETGCNIVQLNGQRRFGPPANWVGPPPPRGSEVFIGNLPRDVFEYDLVPVLSSVGRIYEFRLMMDFSGSNRGFGFAVYSNINEAKRAIKELNGYQIRPGRHIGVVKSVDNCRLYVGGIPKKKSKEEIFTELNKLVSGIVDIHLYQNCFKKNLNRGFVFVEFASHRAAAMARRSLVPGVSRLFGRDDWVVDWAEPEPDIDDELMEQVKVLYARNFSIATKPEFIKSVFEDAINTKIVKLKKFHNYAFIHFFKRSHAEQALLKLQNLVLDGNDIEIVWARPVVREEYKFQKALKGHAKFKKYKKVNSEALFMYKPCEQENPCNQRAQDEGIGACGVDNCFNSHIETKLSTPHMPSEDTKATTAVYELYEMCKSYGWAPPEYFCKTHDCWNGYRGYISYLDVPHVKLPLMHAPVRITFTSKLCNTVSQAHEDATQQAIQYLKERKPSGVLYFTSTPLQPFYQSPTTNFYNTRGYNFIHSQTYQSAPLALPAAHWQ